MIPMKFIPLAAFFSPFLSAAAKNHFAGIVASNSLSRNAYTCRSQADVRPMSPANALEH